LRLNLLSFFQRPHFGASSRNNVRIGVRIEGYLPEKKWMCLASYGDGTHSHSQGRSASLGKFPVWRHSLDPHPWLWKRDFDIPVPSPPLNIHFTSWLKHVVSTRVALVSQALWGQFPPVL
jgi:hypothetical protein